MSISKALFFLSVLTPLALQGAHNTHYGQKFDDSSSHRPLSVDEAIGKFKDSATQDEVIIAGQVKEVCQKSGCWLMLPSSRHGNIRVRFKDYGFKVPKGLKGKRIVLKGTLREKWVSAANIRHYMRDAGSTPEEIAQVKKPQKRFQITASGILADL